MERILEYKPSGVCSSKMVIKVNGDIIESVNIVGGCPGNSTGISRLCEGRKLDEVIEALSGIDCRGRGTSCPDQLAKVLEKIKEQQSVLS